MKSPFIFFLFLVIGVAGVVLYTYTNYQQNIFPNMRSSVTTKFSLSNAPEESLKGKIASMSGSVHWLSRIAEKTVPLQYPRSIQQSEELQTGKNGKVNLLIQNVATVIMSPTSDVNFIQMLPINVVIAQDKGTVQYQDTGQSLLSVRSFNLLTTVSRARAVISVDPDSQTVTITVQKGSVTEGYEDSQKNSKVVSVTAGSEFVFDASNKVGQLSKVQNTLFIRHK